MEESFSIISISLFCNFFSSYTEMFLLLLFFLNIILRTLATRSPYYFKWIRKYISYWYLNIFKLTHCTIAKNHKIRLSKYSVRTKRQADKIMVSLLWSPVILNGNCVICWYTNYISCISFCLSSRTNIFFTSDI